MRTIVKPITFIVLCVASTSMAGVVLQPAPAPEWQVSGWFDADPGSLGEHRGRVVLIGFLHLSCRESTEFAIPLFRRWSALYGDREDVAVVLIHTGVQGRDSPSLQRLAEFVRESAIVWPVGIDAEGGTEEPGPATARRYEIGRTPNVVIVDKHGMLRFTHAGNFDVEPVEGFVERLLEESETFDPVLENDPSAEQVRPAPKARLSGAYVFRTEQATGVCATWIPRVEVPAKLRVYRDAIDIEFVEPFLGMNDMEVSFDADSGRVEGAGRPTGSGGPNIASGRALKLQGVLDSRAEAPELEFEVSFPDAKCSIRGRARAEP